MTELVFEQADGGKQRIRLDNGETVLNGLLRSGVNVPNGCRSGICQSCLLQSPDSNIPSGAQAGLKQSQTEEGLFLSCCCKPTTPMTVRLTTSMPKVAAIVLEKKLLSAEVIRLRVSAPVDYRSGQYVALWRDENTVRTYSIASLGGVDQFMEFHIRRYPDGRFSNWVANSLEVGETLFMGGPRGDCIYSPAYADKTLLLAGVGTGLSPLYGIARDALRQAHAQPIHLFVGAKTGEDMYLVKKLEDLKLQHSQLHVHYAIMNAGHNSDIYTLIRDLIPSFDNVKLFLCGRPDFVEKLKKQCFLAGAGWNDISSVPFIPYAE